MLLLLASFTVLAGYSVWLLDNERNARLELINEQLNQSTNLISVTQQNLINQTELILNTLSAETDFKTAGADPEFCQKKLATYLHGNPEYLNIGYLDQNSMVECSASPSLEKELNFSHFTFPRRAILTKKMEISDVRISPITQQPTLYFALSKPHPSKHGNRVFFISLNLTWLNTQLASYSTLKDAELSIIDGKGNLIANTGVSKLPTSPSKPAHISKTDVDLFKKLHVERTVANVMSRNKDVNELLVSFVRLAQSGSGPVVLVLSLDKKVALAPVLNKFYLQIGLTIALLLSIWVVVFWGGSRLFISRINTIYQATRRLAAGDMSTRVKFKTNGDELDTLGHSFDQMATTLQEQHDELIALNQEVVRVNRSLKVLSSGNRALLECVTEKDILQRVSHAIITVGGYDLAAVAVLGADKDNYFKVTEQKPSPNEGEAVSDFFAQLPVADIENLIHHIRHKGSLIIAGESDNFQSIKNKFAEHNLHSVAFFPLKRDGLVNGVLMIGSSTPDEFCSDEVSYLEESASDISFGITSLEMKKERNRLVNLTTSFDKQLREGLEDTLEAIAAALEMRDPYTAGHERRVADLALALAKKLQLSDDEAHSIYLASVVHDIGKMKIPAEILVKPAKLSATEYKLVQEHVTASYDILKGIKFPWPIADMVHQHHERLDGSGYPLGLKDGDILFGARIMAVADVVESMASHRPYRPALGIEAALIEIRQGKDVKYDASVVNACVALFEDNHFTWEAK